MSEQTRKLLEDLIELWSMDRTLWQSHGLAGIVDDAETLINEDDRRAAALRQIVKESQTLRMGC